MDSFIAYVSYLCKKKKKMSHRDKDIASPLVVANYWPINGNSLQNKMAAMDNCEDLYFSYNL